MSLPGHCTPGAPRHGVVRFGRELARAAGQPEVALEDAEGSGPLHLHVTDRLWGASAEEAAGRIETLAAATPVSVTLHDLPQPSDGPRNHGLRAAAYRRIATAARAVAVSSAHEAALLAALHPRTPAIIPLPVDALPGTREGEPDDEVALLGFVYPGKGHLEAITAVAEVGGGLGVTALGGPSPGHEADLAPLAAHAEALGVRFTVTGYLGEGELLARSRRAAVPLAGHRHVSASGSLNSWVAAGRRPLVSNGAYAHELATLRPGTLTPYDDLAEAVRRARREPASTWLAPGTSLEPGLAATARAYRAWWGQVAW